MGIVQCFQFVSTNKKSIHLGKTNDHIYNVPISFEKLPMERC